MSQSQNDFYKNILTNTKIHDERLNNIYLGPSNPYILNESDDVRGVKKPSQTKIKENKEILTNKLTAAYADEWLAVYQYSVESDTVLKLLMDNTISKKVHRQITKELDIHAKEEFEHAKKIIPFLIELGSGPISHLDQLTANANGSFLVPKDNHRTILKQAIQSEQGAIQVYTDILSFIKKMDINGVSDINKVKLTSTIQFILEQEEEHETDLQKILTDIGPE